jgi:DNA-binding IscR family transcriptional regulator
VTAYGGPKFPPNPHFMAINNVQFTVAMHILTVLGYHYGNPVTSGVLAESVNAEPTFVRRTVSRLAKAGLLIATRGKNGACYLARPASEITLLEIYRASLAPATFSIHHYPAEYACPVSSNIKGCLSDVLADAQAGFEERLARRTLDETIAGIRKAEKKAKGQRGRIDPLALRSATSQDTVAS